MTSTSKLLIKLLLLQISVLHCFHLPNNPFDSVKQSSRFLDIESSKKLVKFLNEVKSNFGWIYNATVPHGYNITENSYNVPVYSKIEPEGELELTGYTKGYIIEPEDSDDDVKKIPTEMTMFEKFERFKNNIDLMFMTKVILKILVFKKIVKFIALVCLLFFLPTINDNSTNDNDTDETNRKLKSDENSTIWDNFDYRSKEILYFTSQALEYATVDKMVWCVAEHDAFCRFESMMDGIDQIYTIDNIIRWWYPQTKPRLLKYLDTISNWKNKFFEKFENRFHLTQLAFHDDVARPEFSNDGDDDEVQEIEDVNSDLELDD